MRRLLQIFSIFFAVLLLATSAVAQCNFNAQGSTLVPNITFIKNAGGIHAQGINITNITGNTVQCKVTVYNNDGIDMTSNARIYTGSQGTSDWSLLSTGTGEFQIPAHSTRMFTLNNAGSYVFFSGYAVIEWKTSNTKIRKALIAGGRVWDHRGGHRSMTYYSINNGQPF